MSRYRCGTCGQLGHNARRHGGGFDKQTWEQTRRRPRDHKAAALWSNYRLRPADYNELVQAGCGICGRLFDGLTLRPDVDHDHTCDHPGKGQSCCRACVRGVLCRVCNLRLGAYEAGKQRQPDPRILAYLGQHRPPSGVQASLFQDVPASGGAAQKGTT